MASRVAVVAVLVLAAALILPRKVKQLDADYIPYRLKGFNVYLYDETKAPDGDYYAGFVECEYAKRDEGLTEARDLATTAASELRFDTRNGRFYILCTVTADSQCATKVR